MKYKLNIDFLEVCYTATPDVMEWLLDTSYYDGVGYRLKHVESPDNREYLLDVEILYSVETDTPLEWQKYATIRLSRLSDTTLPYFFVWVKLDNKVFYTPFNSGSTILSFLYYVTENIGLHFHNITRLDIALDSFTNFFRRLKRTIRKKEYTPIVLGKAYTERKEIISPILYIHSGDRIRYRTNTLSISTKDKDSSLCVYDKGEEIKESGKEYIAEWDRVGSRIFRTEVRLRKRAVRDFLSSLDLDGEEFYRKLSDNSLLFDIFHFWTLRLLRFRKGSDTLSILEV